MVRFRYLYLMRNYGVIIAIWKESRREEGLHEQRSAETKKPGYEPGKT
jgi:hypothetical protein